MTVIYKTGLTVVLEVIGGEPGLVDKVLAFTQEVEGSTPTGGTCPNDFSDPIDQDIRTEL